MLLLRPIATCLLLISSAAALAQTPNGQPQLVVLKNGNVLRGSVENAGDYLRVVSAGSELNLRAADVDFLSDSVEAAYREFKQRMTTPSAIGHMQLAAWCIKHELWEAAQNELVAAKQLEPNHPRLAILEQTAAHLKQIAQSKPKATEALPKNKTASVNQSPSPLSLPTEMPKEALEDFTRRVQPILVNNCTTSGCHRMDGPQKFQLNRDLLHGMANRRSTMRNLTATLALVNVDVPQESELLSRAATAHAGMIASPLPAHQRELHKRLEDWAIMVSGKKPPEPAIVDPTEQIAGGMRAPETGVVPANAIEEPMIDPATEPLAFDEMELFDAAPSKPLRVGVQLKKWEPRDEFDPEIFNRLQLPASQAPVETAPMR